MARCAETHAILHLPTSILVVLMIESVTGLILRTRPLTETSLIVHWLTPGFGRMATVARGARRAKSPFLGRLDLFYLADFSFSRSRRSDLHALREVSLRGTHSALRQDIHRLQQAAYAAALIEQATETETPLPAVFALMTGYLDCLCHHPPVPHIVLTFELKFLHELGLHPDLNKTKLTPGAKQIVRTLTEGSWPAGLRLKPTGAQTEELRQFLHGFLIFHLGRQPKGRTGALA
jgi:DNA repair protein RecO (recombination protein O)